MGVENTQWAREFLDMCPSQYDRAIELASVPDAEVEIYHTDENGELLYAIAPVTAPDFWFDAFPRKKDAVFLCYAMGWKIKNA